MDVLSFISRYEALLKEKNIKKAVFYADCKLSAPAVSKWRAGTNMPAMTTITRIADYLGTTPEYLLTGTKKAAAQEGDGDAFFSIYDRLSPDRQADLDRQARLLLLEQQLEEGGDASPR